MSREELMASYLKMIAIFAVLFLSYNEFFVGSQLHADYITFLVNASSNLLSLFGFDHTTNIERQLGYAYIKTDVGGGVVNGGLLLVNRDSDALREVFLLLSVIIGWQLTIRRKIIAVILGTALMIGLNLFRIAGLTVVDHYWPLYFPVTSQWIFPGLLVLFALAFMFITVRLKR